MTIVYGQGVFGSGIYGGSVRGSGVAPQSTVTGNAVELALDPETWDIANPPYWLRGVDAIIQRIRVRLKFFSGEWFLDTRLGIPYFDQILVKNPRLPVVNAIFRRAIKGTPGVVNVPRLSVTPDYRARTGTIDFLASLDDGVVLTATKEPFIVRDRSQLIRVANV